MYILQLIKQIVFPKIPADFEAFVFYLLTISIIAYSSCITLGLLYFRISDSTLSSSGTYYPFSFHNGVRHLIKHVPLNNFKHSSSFSCSIVELGAVLKYRQLFALILPQKYQNPSSYKNNQQDLWNEL